MTMNLRPTEGKSPVTVTQMPRDRGYAPKIVQDDLPDILHSIRKPSVALALWHRPLPPGLEKWLLSLLPDQLPQGRVIAVRGMFERALDQILRVSATPRSKEAFHFVSDVVKISTLFADIAETNLVDIGLNMVVHDSCWKFHRDHVRYRALTTYFGPSTEYVSQEDANRAVTEQKSYGGVIHHIPRHAVTIFKGAKDALGKGVVHRSPPINTTGQKRLVLTLNIPGRTSPEYSALGPGPTLCAFK
jgi:hypothetical protein